MITVQQKKDIEWQASHDILLYKTFEERNLSIIEYCIAHFSNPDEAYQYFLDWRKR